jgi:hypothetical protein
MSGHLQVTSIVPESNIYLSILCFFHSKSVLQASIEYVQFISGPSRDYLLTLDGSYRKKRDDPALLTQTARSSSASSSSGGGMDSSGGRRGRAPIAQQQLSSSDEGQAKRAAGPEEIDLESRRISFSEFVKVCICILLLHLCRV